MNARLISPWKRKNSSQYWFRMVVPVRYRAAVGKTEIKQSLGTTDIGEARRLCADRQSVWLQRFETIELEMRASELNQSIAAVDAYLDRRAADLGGMDRAISCELEFAALAEAEHLAAFTSEDFGMAPGEYHPLASAPYPAYRETPIRRAIELRRSILATTTASALPGRETVDRALTLNFPKIAASTIEEALENAGLNIAEDDPRFTDAANHLLARLIGHAMPELDTLATAFPSPVASREPHQQPTGSRSEANGMAAGPAQKGSTEVRDRILSNAVNATTISQVFEVWASAQPVEAMKLCDEWRVAIRRFVELFGDQAVETIDSNMIIDFREAMTRFPSRPKRDVSALPLLDQIDAARNHGLPTLAGATVAKLVSGIRVTLDYACDPLRLISTNPAAAVKVRGTKSASDARLPFSPEELRHIFADPMMTDPSHRSSTTAFWLVMMAPLTGMRIEELGKLRPENVRCERGIWYISIERDRKQQRRAESAEGKANKGAKTKAAYRDIAIHWLLIEAGLVEYAQRQRDQQQQWLFPDLVADRYGNRSKAISRELIRHLRAIGITDEEKVFHSFRHAMKRACRQSDMKEEIADLLAGHAPASIGRKYGAGAALDVLHDAVNLIEFETIDWDPVVACGKARAGKG